MDKELLKDLMKVKEYPCVSIIFPTYRTVPENQKNAIRLKNMVRQTTDRLEQEVGKKQAAEIIESVQKLAAQVDISHTLDGIALFVSNEVSVKADIPFRVKERVIIDKTFAVRDLIMGVNRATQYFILDLSLFRVRLISCFRDQGIELSDKGFPMESEFTQLELNPADFSKEKEKQIKEFFNKVDKQFHRCCNGEFSSRIVLAGVRKNLALYREVTDNKNTIIGQLEGNYEALSAHDLGKKAWEVVREKTKQERHATLNDLQRALSSRRLASGIAEVWRLANEGRIDTLVAEQEYHIAAGLEENNTLVLDTSNLADEQVMPDAVDEVAELVIEKGGKVVFVDDGTLGNHQKIAAILRY